MISGVESSIEITSKHKLRDIFSWDQSQTLLESMQPRNQAMRIINYCTTTNVTAIVTVDTLTEERRPPD